MYVYICIYVYIYVCIVYIIMYYRLCIGYNPSGRHIIPAR